MRQALKELLQYFVLCQNKSRIHVKSVRAELTVPLYTEDPRIYDDLIAVYFNVRKWCGMRDKTHSLQPPAHKEVAEPNEPLLPLPFNDEEDLYLSDNGVIPTSMEEAYALVKNSHHELREAQNRLEAFNNDYTVDGEKLVSRS